MKSFGRLLAISCVTIHVAMSADGFAQDLASRSLLRPITSPVRDAGVYHLGLGTWTRRVDVSSASNLDVIFSNSCPVGYYGPLYQHEYLGDEGRVPGPNGPVLCDPGRLSSNAGCECAYVVSAFQIGYCTTVHHPVDVRIGFQSAYIACAVPATQHSFTLTGLPGQPLHTPGCWLVTIDLAASGQSFTMAADGASCTWAPTDFATAHLFGWTFENLTPVSGWPGSVLGPMLAGWGGPAAPTPTCSQVDNTRWDTLTCPGQGGGPAKWPFNTSEDGWGLDTQDRFRIDTTVPGGQLSPPSGPGCYYFGSPANSFHLRLFADTGCPPPPASDMCIPGVGGVIPCPCSNPQVPAGSTRGCNNSASTGGAALSSSGSASLTADTLQFTSTGETPSASSILMQGQLPAITQGATYGQGVRCIATAVRRLYLHSAVAGTVVFPQGADLPIHDQSAAKGDVILAPSTRLYAVYYRDPTVLGACPPSATWNITQAQSLVWVP